MTLLDRLQDAADAGGACSVWVLPSELAGSRPVPPQVRFTAGAGAGGWGAWR